MDTTGMGLGMWIFWIVVVLVVVLFIKLFMSTENLQSRPSSESPLDILKKRYAKGEIDEEEFERRRKELGE